MGRACTTLVAIGIVTLTACSESPGPPSAPSTPTTVTPTAPQVREVTIIGAPSNVQPGDRAQVRAISRAADGGLQDVTAQATWQSSDASVCSVNDTGMVEGRGAGTTTLTASHAGISGSATLTCGYVITATVHENAPTVTVVVPNARVEVEGGALNGRVFDGDATGRVTLPPVTATGIALNFKHPDYEDMRIRITELPRQTVLDVGLMPALAVRFEDRGQCPDHAYRHYFFTTTRESRLRFSTLGRVSAALFYYDPQGRFHSLNLQETLFEMVGPPAKYELIYTAHLLCQPPGPWSILMEHAR